jgi:hypothetical protein
VPLWAPPPGKSTPFTRAWLGWPQAWTRSTPFWAYAKSRNSTALVNWSRREQTRCRRCHPRGIVALLQVIVPPGSSCPLAQVLHLGASAKGIHIYDNQRRVSVYPWYARPARPAASPCFRVGAQAGAVGSRLSLWGCVRTACCLGDRPRLKRIHHRGKQFELSLVDERQPLEPVVFTLSSAPECKAMWSRAVSAHGFYRLKTTVREAHWRP